jgi:hypothetical protein
MQVLSLFVTIAVVVTLINFFRLKYFIFREPGDSDLSNYEDLVDFCFILFLTLLKEVFSYQVTTIFMIGITYFILFYKKK